MPGKIFEFAVLIMNLEPFAVEFYFYVIKFGRLDLGVHSFHVAPMGQHRLEGLKHVYFDFVKSNRGIFQRRTNLNEVEINFQQILKTENCWNTFFKNFWNRKIIEINFSKIFGIAKLLRPIFQKNLVGTAKLLKSIFKNWVPT